MSVDVERHGKTLLVTLNRPDALNALDLEHLDSLRGVLCELRDDPSLLTAVVTGSGRAFCVGTDLKDVPPPTASFAQGYFSPRKESIDAGVYVRALTISSLNLGKPLIAAVNGYAIGGGFELALAADLRVASETASFGMPEARWASVPGVGGVSYLLRSMPRAVAMKLILTGDRVEAADALRLGLVSDVHDGAVLVDRALELAARIEANGPLAIQGLKLVSDRTEEMSLSQSIELEQLLWGLLRDTDDRLEGRRAFVERREPQYEGR
ncbi:enoyl-CoA hydratase/isomerase family protein [Nocardioides sp. LHD-245]|uniref:enoyl-CoA hydratase/isomerase family protein n=1 Tax=Nocardioides sp. LHD-245 TaxID=3051387 RepID=UPI0027DF122E|nr:enoyl-CoA hydratase/isomerase family protein [Nocardioides sp. LHD-245]